MKLGIYILFALMWLVATGSDDVAKLDSLLSETARLTIKTANTQRAFQDELGRLQSVVTLYENVCLKLEKELDTCKNENLKHSKNLKVLSEQIEYNEKAFDDFAKWVDKWISLLKKDTIASAILKSKGFTFDESLPVESRFSNLVSALQILEKEDRKINTINGKISSGLWKSVVLEDADNSAIADLIIRKSEISAELKK